MSGVISRLRSRLRRQDILRARIENLEKGFTKLQESIDNHAAFSEKGFARLHESIENHATFSNPRLNEILDTVRLLIDQRIPRVTEALKASREDDYRKTVEELRGIEYTVKNLLVAQNREVSEKLDGLIKSQMDTTIRAGLSRSQTSQLPMAAAKTRKHASSRDRKRLPLNQLGQYRDIFSELRPWSGVVPKGFMADSLGVLTRGLFRRRFEADTDNIGGKHVQTVFPALQGGNGEAWFEFVNWVIAAREAKSRYVMMTLGACYGAQAVGACLTLRQINPMPYKLVAVEPDPENFQWLRQHMVDNDIDPEAHWLVPMAISNHNDPVLFPVGSPGSGANNCVATNDPGERQMLVESIISKGKSAEVLRELMLHNSTGIVKNMLPEGEAMGEIKSLSSITLRDLLGPFDLVDYVEADMQQSEILVFPPCLDILREKVRRIHIGTHGKETHWHLHNLFEKSGWEMVFSYEPDAQYESEIGNFTTNDGILTVRNPDL
jgi:hypothetical protein